MKTHALLKNGEVHFLQVRSSKYLAVSFTKTLPLLLSRSSLILLNYVVSKISTYVHMRGSHCTLHSFSFNHGFSYWVFLVRFLTRQHLRRIMDIKGKCYEYYGDAIMASLKYTCSPSFTCSPSGIVHKLL